MDLAKDLSLQEDFVHVLRMLTFYEHLSISVTSGYLNQKAAQSFFGETFVWWYTNYFESERGLPSTNWELRPALRAPYTHLERKASKDFSAWLINAREGPRLEREGIAKLVRDDTPENH